MSSTRCAACGTANPAESQYCSACARRLDEATSAAVVRQRSTAVATQTTTFRWTSIVAVSATLVVIIVVVLVLVLVAHV